VSRLFDWRQDVMLSNLAPTGRWILHALAMHMNREGSSCFPAIATVARETGYDERTVRRWIDRLDGTWITVTRSSGRRSHSYVARWPDNWQQGLFQSVDGAVDKVVPNVDSDAATRTQDPVNPGTGPTEDVMESDHVEDERVSAEEWRARCRQAMSEARRTMRA
jgi:hypothetical protein